MNIKTVTVIGVTGAMGANVAGIFASFGDARVYCVGRDIEIVKKSIFMLLNSGFLQNLPLLKNCKLVEGKS